MRWINLQYTLLNKNKQDKPHQWLLDRAVNIGDRGRMLKEDISIIYDVLNFLKKEVTHGLLA